MSIAQMLLAKGIIILWAYYLEMIPVKKFNDPNHYMFLLADDYGAAEEAHKLFPRVTWSILTNYVIWKIKPHWEIQLLKLFFYCSFLIWCRIVLY